ncbi:chitinase [Brachybacterium ginsengisoli]|uniref:Chitinase n=1 Tax=Brachybacterium ginsengisoli TaxID=1331682 RepID=A0A291GVT7_9MICO|nr:endo-beta-N-acetylglucosaminidase H [Brachybacterium ginsengisoli]ATG54335.1 chitinase [Brachybacterium ginsengisoli]
MTHISRRSVLTGLGVLAASGSASAGLAGPASAAPERLLDRIASVAYIEVNTNSLLNAGRYTLDDGSPAFDIAVIFAANINYDGTNAYLSLNENVQRVLDEADTCIRPLQEKGIKVVLSVLGNHQGAGFANFPTPKAADAFAQQVAQVVCRYGLDGVDLDDEWAEYGANGTSQPNDFSFVALVGSLRKRLPNRLLTFYVIGPSAERLEHEGTRVGDLIDYAWNPYYGAYNEYDVPGLPRSQYGAAAFDLSSASTSPEQVREYAERTVQDGFGAFVTYQLPEEDTSELVSAFTEPLYGSPASFA